MTFAQSVSFCLSNYFTVSGRGSRSEYWWFILACTLAELVGSVLDPFLGHPLLEPLIGIATFVPTITAATRRLHDTDRSGWWQLFIFVPIVGAVFLLIWMASRGTDGANRFGAGPAASAFGPRLSVPGSA